MKLTKEQWERIATIILGAALAVFAVLGWVITPNAPALTPEQKAAERIAVLCTAEAGNCVEGWNGSGIALYSDEGATQKFAVNGATGAVTLVNGVTVAPAGAGGMTLGSASATSIILQTDGGSVTVDGTLNGVAPAGITAVPASGTWTFSKTTSGTAALIGADDAGAANTLLDTTGAGAITIGSIDVTGVTLIDANATTIQNGATGSVTLDFRDYADTTDDDMAHSIITTNCTNTGSGTENCDFTIGVVEGGAAAETRLNLDADAGITLGSANTNLFTVTTDSTGDGEVVLPAESVSAGEITNPVRDVALPLSGWIDCTTQLPLIATATDAKPNFTAVNSAAAITYDVTGGSVDTDYICTSFTVPPDYVSGGAFKAQVTEGAATVTQVETFSCDLSLDGAALVGVNAANLANQTAVQTVTSTPVVTYAAGKSVGILCKQGNASADDLVNFLSIQWQYTATQ